MSEIDNSAYKNYKETTRRIFDADPNMGALIDHIESGHNTFSLFQRKLEKTIDIKWVDAIEECIIPLDTIVRNPRRFIVQEETIVPIERAKKINAESIRHLAQHTYMINDVSKDGKVTPKSILNIFREETIDIYENRFIHTLICNLQNFIRKRYDAIFKMEGNQNVNVLNMQGETLIGNETVTYNLEVASKISEKLSDMDDKGGGVFARIQRISTIVNEFASSQFMRDLDGCVPVRPPITKTNAIQNDINLQKCLNLWVFIESYDEVGYSIDVSEKTSEIEEDYIRDLQEVEAYNYMLLKNHTDETFDLSTARRRRKIKPKYIKNVVRDLLNDYDISEVEVKQIFTDEITRLSRRRQEDEKKIEDAIDRCLASEKERMDAIIAKKRAEEERLREIERKRIEREKAKAERARRLEEERIAREKAKEKARKEREAKLKAIALEKERLAKQREREKLARQKAAALEKERLAKQREKEKAAKAKAEALEKERLAKEKAREKARIEREKAAKAKAEALEKERIARERAKAKEKAEREKTAALEKARIARERAKDKERLAKEKAAAEEKARIEREKAKEKERAEREKAAALERERIAKEKAEREKAAALEAERVAKEKAKEKAEREKAAAAEKARIEKEKALEKERLAKEKLKEKEKLAKEKAAAAERERVAREKAKEKERAEKAKALAAEKARIAKEKLKEKERLAKEKAAALEKERLEKLRAKEKERIERLKAEAAKKERIAREKAKEKERLLKEKATKQ